MSGPSNLIIVSNRLPFTIRRSGDEVMAETSSGGLVTALLPIVKQAGAAWIGWSGAPASDPKTTAALQTSASAIGISRLACVPLTAEEERCFYRGSCNEIIWPLFHDLISQCDFDPEYWDTYRAVNEKFADVIDQMAASDDVIWVHDYHLMLVAGSLRGRRNASTIAYFHHIPFPSLQMLVRLPWAAELIDALLAFDCVAFQTQSDCDNFAECVRTLRGGQAFITTDASLSIVSSHGSTTVHANPISIDFQEFLHGAKISGTAGAITQIKASLQGAKLALAVDRLDHSKGILERLSAFRALLAQEPAWRTRVTLLQLLVPSREEISGYKTLKDEIENLISNINGEFGTPQWVPIRYLHRSVSRQELAALYRSADVMMVTPLKDGMNLVAKEFCASRTDESGVLVLSKFAGAINELAAGALVVNPFDRIAMLKAVSKALQMSADEQRFRMRSLRRTLRANDIFKWFQRAMAIIKNEVRVVKEAELEEASAPTARAAVVA